MRAPLDELLHGGLARMLALFEMALSQPTAEHLTLAKWILKIYFSSIQVCGCGTRGSGLGA